MKNARLITPLSQWSGENILASGDIFYLASGDKMKNLISDGDEAIEGLETRGVVLGLQGLQGMSEQKIGNWPFERLNIDKFGTLWETFF